MQCETPDMCFFFLSLQPEGQNGLNSATQQGCQLADVIQGWLSGVKYHRVYVFGVVGGAGIAFTP